MNEWVLVGLVLTGTVIALGGGGWIMSVFNRKKVGPKS